jgi:hypothetical protein
VATGERPRRSVAGTEPEERPGDEDDRPARLDGAADELLGRDDLQPAGEVEPPAQPRFGDEGVEHGGS